MITVSYAFKIVRGLWLKIGKLKLLTSLGAKLHFFRSFEVISSFPELRSSGIAILFTTVVFGFCSCFAFKIPQPTRIVSVCGTSLYVRILFDERSPFPKRSIKFQLAIYLFQNEGEFYHHARQEKKPKDLFC